MSVAPAPGSLGNLFGPDMIVVFGLYAAVFVGVILLVRYLVRGKAASAPAERLKKLEGLRKAGLVTKEEYDEQRRRILGEL